VRSWAEKIPAGKLPERIGAAAPQSRTQLFLKPISMGIEHRTASYPSNHSLLTGFSHYDIPDLINGLFNNGVLRKGMKEHSSRPSILPRNICNSL
jgi:hypothetical protein